MGSIKYYQLAKGEELPDEFCAVRDIDGEPSEYTFYAPESEVTKLREQAEKAWKAAEMLCQAWEGPCHADGVSIKPPCPLDERDELCVYGQLQRDLRELGVEVN